VFDPAAAMFSAMPTEAAVYEDSAGSFALRVNITEMDKAFRTSGRDQIIGSATAGTVLREARVKRGGRITIGARVYRVDAAMASPVPGLTDLKLERIEGDAPPVVDARGLVPLTETVQIGGADIPAQINRSVEVEEVGRSGNRVIVAKAMVAIRVEDAEGIKGGDRITFDGKTQPIARVMSDGLGFVRLLV
jgi:hypothetical protein